MQQDPRATWMGGGLGGAGIGLGMSGSLDMKEAAEGSPEGTGREGF